MHGARLTDAPPGDWAFAVEVKVWGIIHGIRHFPWVTYYLALARCMLELRDLRPCSFDRHAQNQARRAD
jgi:hypothetical protein